MTRLQAEHRRESSRGVAQATKPHTASTPQTPPEALRASGDYYGEHCGSKGGGYATSREIQRAAPVGLWFIKRIHWSWAGSRDKLGRLIIFRYQ